MSKICNYCGAEMQDSEVLCKKCGLPNTGESRELINLKVSAGLYKQREAAGAEIEQLRQLDLDKKLPNEVSRYGGASRYVIAYPSNAIPPEQEDKYLRLRSLENQKRSEKTICEACKTLRHIEQQNYAVLERLRTIKNCAVFFAVLTVIGLVCSFLLQVWPIFS